MKNMVKHVPFVDDEHLARHSPVALVSAGTVLKEAFADPVDGNFVCIRPISASLHLALNVNSERICSLLAQAMLALPTAPAVGIVHNPGGFGLTARGLPCASTDRCHYQYLCLRVSPA